MKKCLKDAANIQRGYRYAGFFVFERLCLYRDFNMDGDTEGEYYYFPVPEEYLTKENDIILRIRGKWDVCILKKSAEGQVIGAQYIIIRCRSGCSPQHLYEQISKREFLDRCRKSCRDALNLQQIIKKLGELKIEISSDE